MSVTTIEQLQEWMVDMAEFLDNNDDPSNLHYTYFVHEPELALHLVTLIDTLDEQHIDDDRSYFSACIFALDVCVAQLQIASENGNKSATKVLDQLMDNLAIAISSNKHTLSFWLPILNAFYEVHVELSEALKNAYLDFLHQ